MTLTRPSARDAATPQFVSEQEYLDVWAERHYEWVNGELIALSPVKLEHNNTLLYLIRLLDVYLAFRPIAQFVIEPFMLSLGEGRYREPDLMLILSEGSVGRLTDTAVIGAADLCIEVVSAESVRRDYAVKRGEYERAGVREYWIIDPERQTAVFNRLDTDRRYAVIDPDAGEVYTTPLLPGLRVHIPTLWTHPLPNLGEVYHAVQAMLTQEGE
jgi:Uma2 family endonuclease